MILRERERWALEEELPDIRGGHCWGFQRLRLHHSQDDYLTPVVSNVVMQVQNAST